MRKRTGIVIGLLLLALLQVCFTRSAPDNVPQQVRNYLVQEISAMQQELRKGLGKMPSKKLKNIYRKARLHYKHLEFFVEYCSPREAKLCINGPLVPKHDEELGNRMQEPQGFQKLEELLYTGDEPADTAGVYTELRLLLEQFDRLKTYYATIDVNESVLLEMCQLEVFRIVSMNLNGYDATISQDNVSESVWCIEGMEALVGIFEKQAEGEHHALFTDLHLRLRQAKQFLRSHTDYATFNRLEFITAYADPLNASFVRLHNGLGLAWSTHKQALDLRQASLFGRKALNLRYFSMYYSDTLNLPQQAELGRRLFFDPILSGAGNRSCASCHVPSMAYADGLAKPMDIGQHHLLPRNTPSLINVVFQKAFFYDGRAYQLEQQASDVVSNAEEMHGDMDAAVQRLRQHRDYTRWFREAFAHTPDSGITVYAVQKALTEYEKTLVALNSRFDRYVAGDAGQLNAREINGYNLFAGKALCGSCHFFPLFNGTVPPFYNDSEFEVLGTPASKDNKMPDADPGRYKVTGLAEQRYAFKTPTVRNVALTAPYMHNGIYSSLEEVVEFYHKGGGNGLGFKLGNQTLPFDSLSLSKTEKEDLVFFLKALSDTVLTGTVRER